MIDPALHDDAPGEAAGTGRSCEVLVVARDGFLGDYVAEGLRRAGLSVIAVANPAFAAANLATLSGFWTAEPDRIFFKPDEPLTAAEWNTVIARIPKPMRSRLALELPATRGEAVIRLAASALGD